MTNWDGKTKIPSLTNRPVANGTATIEPQCFWEDQFLHLRDPGMKVRQQPHMATRCGSNLNQHTTHFMDSKGISTHYGDIVYTIYILMCTVMYTQYM